MKIFVQKFLNIPIYSNICHTLYCALYALYCALNTVRGALCIVRGERCTVRCAQCTVHCARCTVHCAQCTVHCARCTVCCVLCTVFYAGCSVCAVYTVQEDEVHCSVVCGVVQCTLCGAVQCVRCGAVQCVRCPGWAFKSYCPWTGDFNTWATVHDTVQCSAVQCSAVQVHGNLTCPATAASWGQWSEGRWRLLVGLVHGSCRPPSVASAPPFALSFVFAMWASHWWVSHCTMV
jgi:hypothetical protein